MMSSKLEMLRNKIVGGVVDIDDNNTPGIAFGSLVIALTRSVTESARGRVIKTLLTQGFESLFEGIHKEVTDAIKRHP